METNNTNKETPLINEIAYLPNQKFLDMQKKPKKQGFFIRILIRLIIFIMLAFRKYTIKKKDMDKLAKNVPAIFLYNHMQFFDFFVAVKSIFPRKSCNVVSVEAFHPNILRKLMHAGGCYPRRKFVNSVTTVLHVKHILKTLKIDACIYPEARYTQLGTNAVLPESLGKMIKIMKAPLVIHLFHGHHINKPCWGNGYDHKLPIESTMQYILSTEEIEKMSIEEINNRINSEFVYNEWEWLKEKGYKIKNKTRAVGLHKVLYKCPHCNTEFMMQSFQTYLKCTKCEIVYEMEENGDLTCINGESKFTSIPSWCEWERSGVEEEVNNGTYFFNEMLECRSVPHPSYRVILGDVNLTHSMDGFNVVGTYNNREFHIIKKPIENYSLQTEFSSPTFGKRDTFAVSTEIDTFFFFPKNPSIIQKLYFGVEELYKKAKRELKK